MGKTQLLRRLSRAAGQMVQGGLSETTRRCGNEGCICYRDSSQRHGPHMYLTFRHQGKSQSLYVRPGHEEEARRAHAAWLEFRELSAALSALNREQLQRQWRQGKEPSQEKTTRRQHD
jgi:hypothetical protein